MAQSSIEWTEATWNPVVGCTRASAGCDLCYAVTMTRRLAAMGQTKYAGLINEGKSHFNGIVRTHPSALAQPLSVRRGTVYFVNSMSDLFHKEVPFDYIAAVFGVMAASPHHIYQVLTKRPERAAEFFEWLGDEGPSVCADAARSYGVEIPSVSETWPLHNVWVGTSVEDERVSDRIDDLRRIPAEVRFLSCEPLIGPLDLSGRLNGIDWVIVGGESGQRARPMRMEWVREVREAVLDAGASYFFKQTGRVLARELGLGHAKGSDYDLWPDELRAIGERQMPSSAELTLA